ncbi:MAG TPA: VWA domain-containing protein [bacterium]|nr:VWA domain-containing protein [bacterium]
MKNELFPVLGTQIETVKQIDSLKINQDQEILKDFSLEEQLDIKRKQQILSSIAHFIGKDFKIPVELNEPGKGWHWDFQANIIRIDPIDLLEKPIDYLRFVISHEGGHRRISRTDFIPLDVWKQPGFSFMMNAIEDPRDNNFVAEVYPKFQEQMNLAYEYDLDLEVKSKAEAGKKLGYQPRFMQAGFEYIKQWFREIKNQELEITEDLPEEVKLVVSSTIEAARDSWWRYPSREEADKSEDLIKQYAQVSYKINLEKIWPEFKKLIEDDMEDQKMQEFLKEIQEEQRGGSEEQTGGQKELEEEIKKAIEEMKKQAGKDGEKSDDKKEGKGEGEGEGEGDPSIGNPKQEGKTKPVNLDSLSKELKEKIKKHLDSLSEEQKKSLQAKAEKSLADFEKDLNEDLGGKLVEDPEEKADREAVETQAKAEKEQAAEAQGKEEKENEEKKMQDEKNDIKKSLPIADEKELKKYRDFIAKELKKDENVYEKTRREVLPLIDKLENSLREIFIARKMNLWESGFRTGKRIDIKKRIQEKVKSVPAMESKAWQKRELPKEKDYAFEVLVDLSASMQGKKIAETFKAVIVLAEVLNRLSINLEIIGFNDRLYEYQNFKELMSKDIREKMGGMLDEVSDGGEYEDEKAKWNDDGWALKTVAERLNKQKASHKFLLVLSDGEPIPSPAHDDDCFKLETVIEKIIKETDIKLLGLGVGYGTQHVEHYYPNSLANISVEELSEKLADIIQELIVNYDNF